jgi:hypothetical protein
MLWLLKIKLNRYEALCSFKIERQNIFKSVIPYLEKAMEVDPKNADVANTF